MTKRIVNDYWQLDDQQAPYPVKQDPRLGDESLPLQILYTRHPECTPGKQIDFEITYSYGPGNLMTDDQFCQRWNRFADGERPHPYNSNLNVLPYLLGLALVIVIVMALGWTVLSRLF